MRPSLFLLIALLASCAREGVVVATPRAAIATAPVETPFERWQCARVQHALADFHTATLDLRSDGTFELHHTQTTPRLGWTTWLQGTFTRDASEVVLMPETALRRAWIGDGHRAQHGEEVGYQQWEETITTEPWHLPLRVEGTLQAMRIGEVGTSVFLMAEENEAPPCDEGEPPMRSPR